MGTGDDFYHLPGRTVGFRSCVWTDQPTDRHYGTDDLHLHPGRSVEVTDDHTVTFTADRYAHELEEPKGRNLVSYGLYSSETLK